MYINRDSISKICIVSKQPRPRMLQTKYNDVVGLKRFSDDIGPSTLT